MHECVLIEFCGGPSWNKGLHLLIRFCTVITNNRVANFTQNKREEHFLLKLQEVLLRVLSFDKTIR